MSRPIDRAALVCSALNTFGNGAHPEATLENLSYFRAPYIVQCLDTALANARSERVRAEVLAARDHYRAQFN